MKSKLKLAIALLALLFVLPNVCSMFTLQAAAPYYVALVVNNFTVQTLSASGVDLSNPAHAIFSVQNATPLWYSLAVQSNPAGMMPTPADPVNDLISATFFGNTPLLPAADVLPFDAMGGTSHVATLKLALAFSGPNQQVKIQLNALDAHAATMDVLRLLLQLLGQKSSGTEIGLLAPGGTDMVFAAASAMSDFQSLVNDYLQMLQAAQSAQSNQGNQGSQGGQGVDAHILQNAFACARDMVALLTNPTEQEALSNLLWLVQGKMLSPDSILRTVTGFAQVQFGLGIEGFLRDESLALASGLFSPNNPVVVLQTVGPMPSPTPSPSQTPSPAPSPTPSPTPKPVPTHKPMPTRTPKPTHTP